MPLIESKMLQLYLLDFIHVIVYNLHVRSGEKGIQNWLPGGTALCLPAKYLIGHEFQAPMNPERRSGLSEAPGVPKFDQLIKLDESPCAHFGLKTQSFHVWACFEPSVFQFLFDL